MSDPTQTSRALAIAAAAGKFSGDDLPRWEHSEYVRGICEVLADTFGTEDPNDARDEIWNEIATVHAEQRNWHFDGDVLRINLAHPLQMRIVIDNQDAAEDPTAPLTLNAYLAGQDDEPLSINNGGALIDRDVPTMLRTLAYAIEKGLVRR